MAMYQKGESSGSFREPNHLSSGQCLVHDSINGLPDHVDQLDIAPPRGLRQKGDGATTQLSEGNVGNIDLT